MFQINKTNIVLDSKTKEAKQKAESILNGLSSAIDSLVEKKNNHEKEVSKLKDLSDEKNALEIEINWLKEILLDLKQDINVLESHKDDINKENHILINEQWELRVIISKLKEEIENRKKDLSNLIDRHQDALKNLCETDKEIELNILKINELKESNKKIEEDNESLSALLSSYQWALEQKKIDIRDTELEIEEILKEKDSLIAQNNKIQKEYSNAKRQSEEMLFKANDAYLKWIENAKKDSLFIINNAKEEAEKELSSIAIKFNELTEERKKFEEDRDITKWEISEKTKWLSEKETRLREIKNKLESFYWKKINNIII